MKIELCCMQFLRYYQVCHEWQNNFCAILSSFIVIQLDHSQWQTVISDDQDSLLFHLLPYIIPAYRPQLKNRKTKKAGSSRTDTETSNKSQRLSLQERRNSFLVHFNVCEILFYLISIETISCVLQNENFV